MVFSHRAFGLCHREPKRPVKRYAIIASFNQPTRRNNNAKGNSLLLKGKLQTNRDRVQKSDRTGPRKEFTSQPRGVSPNSFQQNLSKPLREIKQKNNATKRNMKRAEMGWFLFLKTKNRTIQIGMKERSKRKESGKAERSCSDSLNYKELPESEM